MYHLTSQLNTQKYNKKHINYNKKLTCTQYNLKYFYSNKNHIDTKNIYPLMHFNAQYL